MRRLYYVADSVEDAQAICLSLQKEGVSKWHVHVLAKDAAGLYTHKIHSANPIHELDIVHTGARFAVLGLLISSMIGGLIYLLGSAGFIALNVPLWVVFALALLGACFGAWEGGMVGLSRENYKIERFHDEIEQGKYLLMVDVSKDQRALVKEMMNFDFPLVPYRGGSSIGIGLLERPKVVHHQTTH